MQRAGKRRGDAHLDDEPGSPFRKATSSAVAGRARVGQLLWQSTCVVAMQGQGVLLRANAYHPEARRSDLLLMTVLSPAASPLW